LTHREKKKVVVGRVGVLFQRRLSKRERERERERKNE